jgi:prepilin-type N-terminal cleavage/methylation domain-containing protein
MKGFLRKTLKAFSIVEVMVAVSIVAILMVISVNAYTKYLAKQMVVKAINATSYLRQAVEDYYALYGYLPGNLDLLTGPGAPYITGYDTNQMGQPWYTDPEQDIWRIAYYNIAADNCTSSVSDCSSNGNGPRRQIEVTFSNPTSTAAKLLSYKTFILRINLNGGVINWECATFDWVGGPVDGTLMPTSCYNPALNI